MTISGGWKPFIASMPDVSFLIDPNQGYTREEAACFIRGVTRSGARMVLLEQPLARDDLEGHARLRRDFQVHVAVDESARSLDDLKAVIQQRAATYLNLKITKSGVLESMAMAAFAKASGLHVMIGGMVETRVAMGCSYGLVMGVGYVDVLDLDTPLVTQDGSRHGRLHLQTARRFNHGMVQASILRSPISTPRCHSHEQGINDDTAAAPPHKSAAFPHRFISCSSFP